MIQINNILELYGLEGNVQGGKIVLFNELDKTMNKDEIQERVVDEYKIMGKKHFEKTWNYYQRWKTVLNIND